MTIPVKNLLSLQGVFKRNTYLPLWLVRLGWLFENLPPLQVQYGFFTTSLHNHSQFLLLLCIFGITVNSGNSRKTMNLKFLSFFFIHFFF